MLVSFSVQGKAGLRFSSGEIALSAAYDATWRISPRLYGFRAGDRYGLLSPSGRQVHPCTLPALNVGFREVTAATVLGWVTQHGIGNLPPLQWVLGRLCHADVLWAEEVTPQLWQTDELRHVLPSGELVHITPAHRAETMPGAPYAADTAAVTQTVLVLTESTHLLALTQQQCRDSAIALTLPEMPPAAGALNPAPNERRAFYRRLRALLTPRGIALTGRFEPEQGLDCLPYEVLRLRKAVVAPCRSHIERLLDGNDPQRAAKTWQLLFLAWLAANDYVRYDAELGEITVSEPFVFDTSLFNHRTPEELLDEYELWSLSTWLRDEGRFL